MADDRNEGAGRNFDELLREIWKSLGRLEHGLESVNEKVDEVKATAKDNILERDQKFREQNGKLDALAARQRDDAHNLANVQQRLVLQVDGVEKKVVGVGQQVSGQEKRLAALEAPVRKAMAAKSERRRSLGKIAAIAATIASISWLIVEPLWKVSAELIVHRLLGGHLP